jgi:Cu-Zn family superoxide dismutase
MKRAAWVAGLFIGTLAQGIQGQQVLPAVARLIDPQGREVGLVELHQTATKGVMLRIEVSGLTPGAHGIHIHAVGRCDPPSFDSAGPHFDPTNRAHGLRSPDGPHAGDVGNLDVPGPGRIEVERMARHVSLADAAANSLFDADGSAVVIHANADDNVSQPSGSSGPLVVCGVIRR